ncbi:hypothetical protein C7S20_18460 [Christiangramia fulva]|uniref:Uncharacterized protein n=1 Tax=Christiangramia fulva TaxID=2126553 RepID=A0A2R3Z9Y0_9FLAO|nr:hypothetical protein [Christiangramia fulva]AVR47071.1 hypothetical protein C7S20_18460 [Christiangramia fulva]
MTNQIVLEAFKKAEDDSGKGSVNGKAEFLSEYILENYKYSISTKSLTRYYKGQSSPNLQINDCLALYLGYEDYKAYLKQNPGNKKNVFSGGMRYNLYSKRNLVILLMLILLIVTSGYIGFISSKKECMVWNQDHYVKTECKGLKSERRFIPYIYNNFKKIQVSDSISFFKNGKANIWYDKTDGEIELFSAPGIHPINGNTLKPITKYMVNKYFYDIKGE